MNIRRILSLSRKEFLHLRNDWWLLAFMILGGALELLLVGWATSRPITNLPFMVLDRDRSVESREFIIAVENTGTFTQAEYVDDEVTILNAIERGNISAALIFDPDFSADSRDPAARPTISSTWARSISIS